MTTGRPDQTIVLPNRTFLPLYTAIAIGLFVLCLLFKFYWLSLVPLAVTLVLCLAWTNVTGLRHDHGELDIGNGISVPPHYEADGPPSWWGMVFLLACNGTLYASLIFAVFFLWLVAPGWPPAELVETGLILPLMTVIAVVGAALLSRMAVAANAGGGGALPLLLYAAGAHVVTVGLLLFLINTALPEPTSHAYAATAFVTLAYTAIHSELGIVFALYGAWRIMNGFVSARRSLDLRIGKLWHDYTALTGVVGIALILVMPLIVAIQGGGQ